MAAAVPGCIDTGEAFNCTHGVLLAPFGEPTEFGSSWAVLLRMVRVQTEGTGVVVSLTVKNSSDSLSPFPPSYDWEQPTEKSFCFLKDFYTTTLQLSRVLNLEVALGNWLFSSKSLETEEKKEMRGFWNSLSPFNRKVNSGNDHLDK